MVCDRGVARGRHAVIRAGAAGNGAGTKAVPGRYRSIGIRQGSIDTIGAVFGKCKVIDHYSFSGFDQYPVVATGIGTGNLSGEFPPARSAIGIGSSDGCTIVVKLGDRGGNSPADVSCGTVIDIRGKVIGGSIAHVDRLVDFGVRNGADRKNIAAGRSAARRRGERVREGYGITGATKANAAVRIPRREDRYAVNAPA